MLLNAIILLLAAWLLAAQPLPTAPPTLEDYWEGRATWLLERADVGLPVGESDTLDLGGGHLRSFLHASHRSAGVVDSCGAPVAFPGCLTTWDSFDGGQSFALTAPVCTLACAACPCDDTRDHITAQQYPRVAVTADGTHILVYEWHAHTVLRTAPDGASWSVGVEVVTPSGTWPSSYAPCSPVERIGPHPNIRGEAHDCLVGAPPGLYVDGDTLYVFVGAGSAPAHMRCYKGPWRRGVAGLRLCDTDPLFGGARDYGPLDARGADANPYFDFRYISSAEVLRVGDRTYMAYEGVRGPDQLERGQDTQFALGFARSTTAAIDGPWERWPGNPALLPTSANFGVGHADLLIQDGHTILITATSLSTRGRYRLVWASAT